jgi:hypothetical protein
MKWTAAGAEVWDVGDAAWYSVIDQKALDAVIANVATNAAGVAANAAAIANINTVGIISMWSGSAASIPAGYLLCNGANGTPNLVNKFIKGSTVAGTTGGSSTHTHTDSFSVSSHTLTTSQMPSHRHAIGRANGGSGGALENRTPSGGTAYTQYTGSSGSHTHGLAGVVNSASTEPVFYTLCFIIKV